MQCVCRQIGGEQKRRRDGGLKLSMALNRTGSPHARITVVWSRSIDRIGEPAGSLADWGSLFSVHVPNQSLVHLNPE
jgi:hypothetical protein